jgi:outer membrane protein X
MKKSIFKKVAIVAIAVLTMNVAALAQEKGDMAVGANLAMGTGNGITNFGLGAKFQYNVLDPLRLDGSFTYFLPKTEGAGFAEAKTSMWDFSVNAHWLLPLGGSLTVYPLAGLGILGVSSSVEADLGGFGSYDASASASEFGFNLGGGIDFKLTEKLILNAEVKYKICGTWSRLLISAGLAYKF